MEYPADLDLNLLEQHRLESLARHRLKNLKPFTAKQIRASRLAGQGAEVPLNSGPERTRRRKAIKQIVDVPTDVGWGVGIVNALANTTAPIEDVEALRGTSVSYGWNWAGNSGMYKTAYDRPKDYPVDPSEGPQPLQGGPSIWINGMNANAAKDAASITHELGHAIQHRGLVERRDERGVYGLFPEDGGPGGTPHPIGSDEDVARRATHEYHEITHPWLEGGAMGYEAKYTPTGYVKKNKYEGTYDDPHYWRTQNYGRPFGPHAYSTYRLAYAKARNTGDPGSVREMNDALRPLLHETDAFGDYEEAGDRMLLNYTARTLAPDQFNMMAVPYEKERKERTEAAGLEFKPREVPDWV